MKTRPSIYLLFLAAFLFSLLLIKLFVFDDSVVDASGEDRVTVIQWRRELIIDGGMPLSHGTDGENQISIFVDGRISGKGIAAFEEVLAGLGGKKGNCYFVKKPVPSELGPTLVNVPQWFSEESIDDLRLDTRFSGITFHLVESLEQVTREIAGEGGRPPSKDLKAE